MEIAVGQIWAVDATQKTPALFVKIGRLDEFTLDNGQAEPVVGVSLIPQDESSGFPAVSHAPIYEHAIALHGARLVAENTEADSGFDDGYRIWLDAYQNGKAGVFIQSPSAVYHTIASVARDG